MDEYFASPESQLCRSVREACLGNGPGIVRSLAGGHRERDFAASSARGLLSLPRYLESRFLYDSVGSALFDQITLQPEYYLTRTEAAILAANAARIRELTGPATLVELGSGSACKSDLLLRAWLDQAPKVCYIPIDVSESALAGACDSISSRHPEARVVGVNCEYREAFQVLAQLSPVLVMFLGSSIGNLTPGEMSSFLASLAASMRAGDFFLLGIDLVKERSLMEAAYNDRAGVTANFTRNLFVRMNRELGCSIDVNAIEHEAVYDADKEQIEIYARFTRQQTFILDPPGRAISIATGEAVQTEICRKFRLEKVISDLERCFFATEQVFTDPRRWFALLLLRRLPLYSCQMKGKGR